MTHPEWCGEDCSKCTKQCELDENIPCSPNCCNFDKNGNPQNTLCKDCDSYKMNYRTIEDLNIQTLIKLIRSYDNYIKENAENNPEFGYSWYPVCIQEYLQNDFLLEESNE